MSKEFTPEMVEAKKRQRLALRNEFLKKVTNPHVSLEGGHLFDPALQRLISLKATKFDYFKETPSTVKSAAVMLLPLAFAMYYIIKKKDETEANLRAGKVAYKDRLFKFT